MRGLNKVMILGNLGSDPEMRYTAMGRAVTRFRVAVNRRWYDSEGQLQERVDWFRVVFFGRQAEVVNQFLERGSPVYVEGRMETRSFEGQDGQTRHITELVGRELILLPQRNGREEVPESADVEEVSWTGGEEGELPL
jgi:single-strand DNA-binding protein